MSDCCNPSGYEHLFSHEEAQRNLRRYNKKGLDAMARRVVDYLTSTGVEEQSILEIGGGIGAIQVELLTAGASNALNVELSGGYEEVAASLLDRGGLAHRAERRLGDFTHLADGLEADVVIMHRVVCCYPDMEALMGAAVSSTRRLLAVTFPRDTVLARIAIGVANITNRIRGIDFKAFVHPPESILESAVGSGLNVAFRTRNLIWHGVVFATT